MKRVFTDANLFNTESLAFINTAVGTILDFLRARSVVLAPGVDLVVDEYMYSDNTKGCQYYFINHEGRCVFWMDKVESDSFPITGEVNGITSASHIRMFPLFASRASFNMLQDMSWKRSTGEHFVGLSCVFFTMITRTHCELYPRSIEVTQEMIDELRDIVLHALGGPPYPSR
jgi:hypothetical protein